MKIIRFLSRFMGYGATVVLGLMMLLTVADVFLRYFFNSPITGTTEVTELMMVIVVFPALAWTAISNKHIRVDILMYYVPEKGKKVIDTITMILSLGIFGILTWQSLLESMEVRSTTSLLNLPHFPFFWVLTVGFAMFSLSIIALIVENIMTEVK